MKSQRELVLDSFCGSSIHRLLDFVNGEIGSNFVEYGLLDLVMNLFDGDIGEKIEYFTRFLTRSLS